MPNTSADKWPKMFNISVYKLTEGDHVDWYFFKKNFHVANLDSKS